MQKLVTAMASGMPCTAVRLAACPFEPWAVSIVATGKVVLSHNNVHKHARLWHSYVSKKLRQDAANVRPSGTAIEVCVAGQWMPLNHIPSSLEQIPVHAVPRQSADLRRRWMLHFPTPYLDSNGRCRSVYQLTNAEMKDDLAA